MGSQRKAGGEYCKVNILKGHSSPVWEYEWGRAVPQGKHRNVVLKLPAGVLVKREGRLGWGVCCLSPLCLWLTLSHTCTQALFSQSPLGARVYPGPRGWRRSILSPSQMARVSPGIHGACGDPGSRGNKGLDGSPAEQAGRSMEDVRLSPCRVRLPGKKVSHLEPR